MSESQNSGSDDGWFSFEMGEFSAQFPKDRMYASNHMWARNVGGNQWQFGLTAYAVRLLQDVYFLDWIVDQGQTISHRQNIGSIESKKAESDLFSPISGTFRSINDAVLDDPSIINADAYEEAWLVEIEADSDQSERIMTPEQYREHLDQAWDVAQRTIKGQANQ